MVSERAAALGEAGRATPVSLFLPSAGVWLTIMSHDRPGACPAPRPGTCLIVCHPGHERSRGRATSWTTARPLRSLLSGIPACARKGTEFHTSWLTENRCTALKKRQHGEGQREIVYRSYVDALWTVHLAGREAVTVSSGLADNMAKGIHLERRGTRRQKEWSDKSWG